MAVEIEEALKQDWTHWTQETYRIAIQVWLGFSRAGIDETSDTEAGREFKRIWENADLFEDWWSHHRFPFQKIYLAPDEALEGDENEWEMVSGPPPVIRHKPTSSMFQLMYNEEDVRENGSFPVSSLYAVLIHHCGSDPVPSGDELVRLGKLSILFWRSGLWKKDDPDAA